MRNLFNYVLILPQCVLILISTITRNYGLWSITGLWVLDAKFRPSHVRRIALGEDWCSRNFGIKKTSREFHSQVEHRSKIGR